MVAIRPIFYESDKAFLWDMLYEMVFIPAGEVNPGKEVLLKLPEISKYLDGFGLYSSDSGFVAESENNQLVGAAWLRLFNNSNKGFGYISDDIPELCIAVIEQERGKGIGGKLLKAIINKAKSDGYRAISLSVDSRNDATRLYSRFGFKKIGGPDDSWIMRLDL